MAPDTWTWRSTFRVNAPRTQRQRLAHWLRRLAARIDGLHSLGIEVYSEPELTLAQQRQCILRGLALTNRLLDISARDEAVEALFQARNQALFNDR